MKKSKIVILKILKENQPLEPNKFDRLFYSEVDYSNNWIELVKELRDEKLIEANQLKITQKGLDFLKTNS